MHEDKSSPHARSSRTSIPAVMVHAGGRKLTHALAHELAASGFRIASESDAGATAPQVFDVILAERHEIDSSHVIDDVRRCFPEARIVSRVTVGVVTIVQGFVGVPGAADVDRLRTLAAAVREGTARAEQAGSSRARRVDSGRERAWRSPHGRDCRRLNAGQG